MISAVIASYKEPHTIGRAIAALASQLTKTDQIIVTAPDAPTRAAAKATTTNGVPLLILKDKGEGKPAALNAALTKATNPFILLTDGDVHVSDNAVKALLPHMNNKNAGIVTGRVVASNPRTTMFGFWAYALTEGFHELRLKRQKTENIIATGYLYLIRKSLIPTLPKETLVDDAYISHHVLQQNKTIIYEPRAEVYVKYPTTLPDWLRQKKRTAGRVYQLAKRFHVSKLHSFIQEITISLRLFRHITSPEELLWLLALFEIKLYVWARVFFDIRLWKRSFAQVWTRIETTK